MKCRQTNPWIADASKRNFELLSYLVEPLMTLFEKTLRPHPTDNLIPYLLFSNMLSDTLALKDSIIAIPASPLSWT